MKRPNGLQVGDKFLVVNADCYSGVYSDGDVVTLESDDGSSCPFFNTPSGTSLYIGFGELAPYTAAPAEFVIGSRIVSLDESTYGDIEVGELCYLVENVPDTEGEVKVRLKDKSGHTYYIAEGAYRHATDAEWEAGETAEMTLVSEFSEGDLVSFVPSVNQYADYPRQGISLTVHDATPDCDGELLVTETATGETWFVDPRELVEYVWVPQARELVAVVGRSHGSSIPPNNIARVVEFGMEYDGSVAIRGLNDNGVLVNQTVDLNCVRELTAQESELFDR